MTLEHTLLVIALAVGCSFVADFVLSWALRTRVRRCEDELDELLTRQVRESKVKAAQASVLARAAKANELDTALVKAHTGVDLNNEQAENPWPWLKRGPS